jgi:hypothetical protein
VVGERLVAAHRADEAADRLLLLVGNHVGLLVPVTGD